MIRDPETAALRDDLEQLGVVVAPHRDHLCVRLPLFASVRVRVDEQGRLDCQPMFGMLPRTTAVLISTTALAGLAGGLLYATGTSSAALLASFLAVMSGFGTAWRFVLTESCITRVQMVWAARLASSKVQGPRSRVQGRELQDPSSKIQVPSSKIQLPELEARN